MRLVIIIPVFNRALTLGNCLNQLHSQIKQIPSFHSIGVVVVNDGSTDGTSRLLKEKHKWVKVVNGTGNWWFTKSVNEGLRYAEKTLSPDSFLLLNEDLILAEDYLNSVLNTLSNQESNNMIFGSLTLDASDPSKYLFVGYKKWVSLINKKQAYRQKDIDEAKKRGDIWLPSVFLPGRGMFFKTEILKRNGYLSNSFPQYGSDFEFCLRARTNSIGVAVALNTYLYSIKELTASDSPVNRPSFFKFFKGLFRKHSSTYLMINTRFVWMYGSKILIPFTFVIIFLGKIKSYFNIDRHVS